MRKISTVGTALLIFEFVLSSRGLSIPKIHTGRCPDIEVIQDFNIPAYMGKWYQQAGYNTEWVAGGDSRCVRAEYSLDSSSGAVLVHNMAVDNKTNKTVEIKGSAILKDPSKSEAKLVVTFNIDWVGDVHGKYWVLGTDYDNYSVVYACNNVLLLHFYTVWILGREQYFSSPLAEEKFFNSSREVLRGHGIEPDLMERSLQKDCAV